MPDLTEDLQRYQRAERRLARSLVRLRPRIEQAIEEGLPANQVAKHIGWSRQRLRAWRKAQSL